MASVRLTYKVTGLPRTQEILKCEYRAWRLECSVTEASETDGVEGTEDANIFVARTNRTAHPDNNVEVFSHVASLLEMNLLPVSKSDIELLPPKMIPKTCGLYRTSMLKLDFANIIELLAAKVDIQREVDLLMRAATNELVLGENTVIIDGTL